jgi:hypothetical protein
LSSFVQWCYHCGLLRIAGNAYQFRHDELQRYFARRHLPPQDGPRRDVTSLGEAAVAAYQVIGQPDAAAEVLRALHQHSRDTLGPFSEAALSLQVRRIFAESTDDSLTDAIDGIDSLLQEQIDILGNRHPDVFASQGSLAALLARAGSYEGALDVLHELRRQQSLYHGDDHVQVLTTRALIAAWGGTESSAAIRETAREEANRLEALRSTSASARRSPELLVSLGRLHEIGGDPAAARSAYEHASRLVDRSGQDIWLQWRLTMLTPPMRGHDHWHIAASRREILLRGLTSHEQMLHMLEEQRPKSSTEIVGRLIESRVAAVKARRDAKQQPVHRQSRPTEHAQLDPELWQQISLIRRAKEDAIDENDFESAIRLRDREKELRAQARQSPPTA